MLWTYQCINYPSHALLPLKGITIEGNYQNLMQGALSCNIHVNYAPYYTYNLILNVALQSQNNQRHFDIVLKSLVK